MRAYFGLRNLPEEWKLVRWFGTWRYFCMEKLEDCVQYFIHCYCFFVVNIVRILLIAFVGIINILVIWEFHWVDGRSCIF